MELLDQAIARDPTFLLAHCQLASTHDLIYFFNYDHTENRLKLAEASIENAVRLQPDAGETHLARAVHLYWVISTLIGRERSWSRATFPA